MKVTALCGGSYVSGMEVKAISLLRGLRDRGRDVHVLTSGWTDGDFPARLEDAGVPHTPVFLGKLTLSMHREHVGWMVDTLRHLPGALWAVRRHLRAFRPDVVLLFHRDSALLAAPLLRRFPCVYHVAELPADTAINARIYGWLSRFVRGWVGVSQFVADQLPSLGVHSGDIVRVYNGIPDRVEATSGREGEGVRVGICGQVAPWKGHDDLLEALGRLARRGVPFDCTVFGRGADPYLAALRSRAAALGIEDRIRWEGFVRDPAEMYGALDVLVAPSRIQEAFGLVAAEAGRNGLPAVVTRRGGLPEVVEDGVTGFVVEAEAPDQLADRLEQLITDPALRRAMGDAARARVAERFSVEEMVEGHERVFEDAIR